MKKKESTEVATHVLVPEEMAARLRKLSLRTRISQADFLREAVDDVLAKHRRAK